MTGPPIPGVSRLGPNGAERISAGAYGLLVAASTLIGLGDRPLPTIVAIVGVTNLVYYATHVFAYTIGSGVDIVGWTNIRHHLIVSAPMLSATFAPVVTVLILSGLGVDTRIATLWGVATAMVLLCGVAVAGASLRGIRGWRLAAVVVGTVVVALTLILAKYSLH